MLLGWATCAREIQELVNVDLRGEGLVLRRLADGSWSVEREASPSGVLRLNRYYVDAMYANLAGVSLDGDTGEYFVELPLTTNGEWVAVVLRNVDASPEEFSVVIGQIPESDESGASPRTQYEVFAFIYEGRAAV